MNNLELQARLLQMQAESFLKMSEMLDVLIKELREANKVLEPLLTSSAPKTIKKINFIAQNMQSGLHKESKAAMRSLIRPNHENKTTRV